MLDSLPPTTYFRVSEVVIDTPGERFAATEVVFTTSSVYILEAGPIYGWFNATASSRLHEAETTSNGQVGKGQYQRYDLAARAGALLLGYPEECVFVSVSIPPRSGAESLIPPEVSYTRDSVDVLGFTSPYLCSAPVVKTASEIKRQLEEMVLAGVCDGRRLERARGRLREAEAAERNAFGTIPSCPMCGDEMRGYENPRAHIAPTARLLQCAQQRNEFCPGSETVGVWG